MKESIQQKMRAGFPLVSIETIEENKVIRTIMEVSDEAKRVVRVFSISTGVTTSEGKTMDLRDPVEFIQRFSTKEKSINIMLDPNPFFEDLMFRRVLKDSIHGMRGGGNLFVFISPSLKIPEDIKHLVSAIESSLPDRMEIGQLFDEIAENLDEKPTEDEKERAVDALIGLSSDSAADALSLSIVQSTKNGHPRIDPKAIMDEKCRSLSSEGYMKVITPKPGNHIGGLENLRGWVKRRKVCFEKEAKRFGLPTPKGILLVGVPGCGKSLTAKQIPKDFDVPLVQLNMGAIFGSLVGESEKNIRRAIATAEAMSPCVLWIDELDKQLSGDASGAHETTRRVIAELLTWLEEKESAVFVVATANNIQGISKSFPEMLRKGRWDEMFFVDLPTAKERKEIFHIHLMDVADVKFPVDTSVEATEGFSGAEIKAIVVDGLYRAFEEKKDLNEEHILCSIRNTIPQSQSARESIQGLREWARGRCLQASSVEKKKKKRKIDI